jgi:hypothetical protein
MSPANARIAALETVVAEGCAHSAKLADELKRERSYALLYPTVTTAEIFDGELVLRDEHGAEIQCVYLRGDEESQFSRVAQVLGFDLAEGLFAEVDDDGVRAINLPRPRATV